ncbi:methyltransferase family protein [Roseibium sp.]|uniref:methyltransferase family protein n=1 Tax=Roseibium sp. TaxID=1936156 RepID=UPI003A976CE0
MNLKVPPLLLTALLCAALWASATALPASSFRVPGQWIIGALLAAAAVLLILHSGLLFRGLGTTVNPTRPETSSRLAVTGCYRFSRNPMYLGMLLGIAAVALALGSLLALVVLPGFVWYMNRFQIEPEERALGTLFGEDYRAYCQKVRRWI